MRFDFTGKLSMPKDKESFHPYQENEYESGWESRRISFSVICGTNRHMVRVNGLARKDRKNKIYTRTKNTYDDNKNLVEGENVQIDFKDRLKPEIVATIADYKKFVFDCGDRTKRYALNTLLNHKKDGKNITEEELKNAGVSDASEIEEAYNKSLAQRHEFISEWDYVEFIKKALSDPGIGKMQFKVSGSAEYQYSEKDGRAYMNYIPTRIIRVADDTEPASEGQINFLFSSNAVDDSSVEEKGRYYINGWTREYESSFKDYIYVPITVVVLDSEDEKEHKIALAKLRKFKVDGDEVREYGMSVEIINGAQQVEITEDMLTDEQIEDLECGLITMDDIRKEMENPMGDRITEYRFIKPSKGFTKGSQETAYTRENMVLVPQTEDNDEDLFDE